MALSGTGVSDGVALGRLHKLSHRELDLPEYHVEDEEIERQVRRLEAASAACESALAAMEAGLPDEARGAAAEMLQVHRLMLRDDTLIGESVRRVRTDGINAEWALDRQAASMRSALERSEDAYLALRSEDLDQIVQLLQRELAQSGAAALAERIPAGLEGTVVLARSLSPAEVAILHQRRVAGVITEHGGTWSHSAILARAYGIPTVMAVKRALRVLREGEWVILDSHYGAVLATEDDGLHGHYGEKVRQLARRSARQARALAVPDRTLDGERFRLFGNAEHAPELTRCVEHGAVGIGLMRTEFLFTETLLPDEETQYQALRTAQAALDGRPLTVRTLDAGGDKLPEALARFDGPNPALGLRGIRLSLALPELFDVQLRAILRASAHGPVRILLPMLTRLDELERARERIAECAEALREEGVSVDPDVQIGGMIETPAAAWMAERFAARLDFLSIGTNDLVQYVLAVDRQDERVSHLFDPSCRAVIELIGRVVRGAAVHQRPVQVCGEMAGDPRMVPVLFGLGVREFSMPPGQLAAVKSRLIRLDAARARREVADDLAVSDSDSVAALCRQLDPGSD
nr:phosphoenolpyruvate--protein phosphotransferase [Wenzhouxiangella sp. XN79A]